MTFHGGRGWILSGTTHSDCFFSLPFWMKLTGTVANHKRDMSPERSRIFCDKKNLQTKAPCWWTPWLNRISLKAAVIWQMHGSRLHQGFYNSTLNDMEDPLQVCICILYLLCCMHANIELASNLVNLRKTMLNWKQFWEIRKHPFWRQSQYFKYLIIFFQSFFFIILPYLRPFKWFWL